MGMTGSSQHSRTGFAGVLHARIAGGNVGDLHAIVEAVLTCGNDRIACGQALVDQRAAAECLAYGDRADLHSTTGMHGEDIGTVLTLLHRAQWHCDAVMPLGKDKVDIDKLAWPERTMRVWKGGF